MHIARDDDDDDDDDDDGEGSARRGDVPLWPWQVAKLVACFSYSFSVISKWRMIGFTRFICHFYFTVLKSSLNASMPVAAEALLARPWLTLLSAAAALPLEASFLVLAVCYPQRRAVSALLAALSVAFHTSAWVMLNVSFSLHCLTVIVLFLATPRRSKQRRQLPLSAGGGAARLSVRACRVVAALVATQLCFTALQIDIWPFSCWPMFTGPM